MYIENFKEQPPSGKVMAIFDIRWPPQFGMVFRNWKAIRGKNGYFIAGPSFKETDSEGVDHYHQLIEFSKEKRMDFEKKVKELLKEYLRD